MAVCPVCDNYEGSPRQVEAHISGLCDEPHVGKVGREFTDEIEAGSVVEISPTETATSPVEEGESDEGESIGVPVSLAVAVAVMMVAVLLIQYRAVRVSEAESEPDQRGVYRGA
jgi:hypothetical protein